MAKCNHLTSLPFKGLRTTKVLDVSADFVAVNYRFGVDHQHCVSQVWIEKMMKQMQVEDAMWNGCMHFEQVVVKLLQDFQAHKRVRDQNCVPTPKMSAD